VMRGPPCRGAWGRIVLHEFFGQAIFGEAEILKRRSGGLSIGQFVSPPEELAEGLLAPRRTLGPCNRIFLQSKERGDF
jgi:hypothetical protein